MSFEANTAFQPRVWNNRNDDTQTIAGRFYNGSTPYDCSAGWLCNAGTVDENGVTSMSEAEDGTKEVYACFPSDNPRMQDNHGNLYAVGSRTLGLGLPAGRVGDFVKLIAGQLYSFGAGNLSGTLSAQKYFTIAYGMLNPAGSAPTSGYYFELVKDLCEDVFTEGSVSGGECYTVRYLHA